MKDLTIKKNSKNKIVLIANTKKAKQIFQNGVSIHWTTFISQYCPAKNALAVLEGNEKKALAWATFHGLSIESKLHIETIQYRFKVQLFNTDGSGTLIPSQIVYALSKQQAIDDFGYRLFGHHYANFSPNIKARKLPPLKSKRQ